MSSDLMLALLAGAILGGGIWLLVASLTGLAPSERLGPSLTDRFSPADLGRRLTIGGGLAVLALLVTQWIVVAIGVGLLGFFGPALFGGARQGRTEVARVEALASWTESLRDTIAGAVGLEQAIPSSYHAAAPVLKPPLALLIDRLRTREPLADALIKFGDDLNDPGADLILAALVLNARLRGPGLRDVLTALSVAAREEMDMRNRIEASRASTRRSVQIITILTLVVVFGLRFINPEYVQPYDSLAGQVTLAVVCGIFAAGFLWLRSLGRYDTAQRFLTGGAPSAVAAMPPSEAGRRERVTP
ncbi:MAG TPA: type II secretion system F family protein [Mycobacteriales bacterium]